MGGVLGAEGDQAVAGVVVSEDVIAAVGLHVMVGDPAAPFLFDVRRAAEEEGQVVGEV